MRNINIISGINGVSPGGVATVQLPPDRRYMGLKMFASGTISAATVVDPTQLIANFQLIVNGRVMRNLTPAQALGIVKFRGIVPNTTTGELPSYFAEPWRASVTGEESTSWEIRKTDVFTLQVQFLSTGITNLTFAVEAEYDYGHNTKIENGVEVPFLAIVKQNPYTNSAPSGASDWTTLPTLYPIQAIHLSASSGTISNIVVENDGEKVLEGPTAQVNDFYKQFKNVPGQFSFTAAFDYTNQISDDLKVRNANLKVTPTCSASNTLTAIVENRAPGFI